MKHKNNEGKLVVTSHIMLQKENSCLIFHYFFIGY